MILFNNITLQGPSDVVFNFYLKSDIVVVHGNSATGKSFFCTTLLNTKRSNGSFEKVVIFDKFAENKKDIFSMIQQERGKLIVIDDGDFLLNKQIAKYISEDMYNQYLIFARGSLNFRIYAEDYADIVEKDGVFYLKYFEIPRGFKSDREKRSLV